jgi:hypothetical protein
VQMLTSICRHRLRPSGGVLRSGGLKTSREA